MRKFLTLFIIIASALTAKAQYGEYVGGDMSMLPKYEEAKTKYVDSKGVTIPDILVYLRDNCNWNTVRVRLFVTPPSSTTQGDIQDLAYVKSFGKRIKDAGMKFMLDFHYSDTWADPAKQGIPSVWKDTSNDGLAKSVSDYTADCLKQLKEAGAEPDLVQIGNEISYGMLWRNTSDKVYPSQSMSANTAGWNRLITLLKAASKAVRDNSSAKIIIHTERTGESAQTKNFYNYIKDVDYDIIGLSYYPFYQGTLTQLSSTLNALAMSFPTKKVQIVETSYCCDGYPTDAKYKVSEFPATWNPAQYWGQAQYDFTDALVTELQKHSNVNGLMWWFPEEAGKLSCYQVWLSRGLWWNTGTDHWPVVKQGGGDEATMFLLSKFVNTGITTPTVDDAPKKLGTFTISGQRIDKPSKDGLYIIDGRKTLIQNR